MLWRKSLDYLKEAIAPNPEEARRLQLLKATALNNLGIVAEKLIDPEDAIKLYKEALDIRQKHDDPEGAMTVLNNMGVYFKKQGHTEAALKYYKESLEIARQLDWQDQEINLLVNLALLYQNTQFTEASADYYRQALQASVDSDDNSALDRIYNGMGGLMELTAKNDSALYYYKRSFDLRKNSPDPRQKANVCLNIAGIFVKMSIPDSAEKYITLCFAYRKPISELGGMAGIYAVASDIESLKKNKGKAIELGQKALELAKKTGSTYELRTASNRLYEAYRDAGMVRESLEMLEIKIAAEDSIQNTENARQLLQEKFKMDYERMRLSDSLEFAKERELQDLRLAKTNTRLQQQRIGLLSAAGILLLVLLLAYVIYGGKRKSERLLLNILPKEVASELKKTGKAAAKHHNNVTVIFTDFKSFTEESARMTPEELVAEVDTCFSAFDRICTLHGVEKIKTIGDAYMAVSGLPVATPDHALRAARAAMDMMQFMQKRNEGQLL